MKAEVYKEYTEIFLSKEEVFEHCKPGEGANTCIWLVVGSKGFECTCLNRNIYLLQRWLDGQTVAKRDGCEKVNNFDPTNLENQIIEL